MQNELANATIMLQRFKSSLGDEEIPKELLDIAKGVAFITIFKVGFMFTGRYGTGFVVTKLDDGTWSAPSAITLSGLGWGFQIGAELTEVMLILSTEAAVETFKSVGQISVGAELSVSVGPLGRSIGSDVSAGDKGAAHAFSYATSKGLFFGASLEASGIAARADVNQKFYGEDVPISSLLSGEYPRPKGAEPLYEALADVMGAPKTSSVSGSYVPGRNSEKNDDDAAVPLDNM
jgi:lipid-binding SYLF domain-containing protein